MSLQLGTENKKTGKAIVDEVKDLPAKATKEGVAKQTVGYVIGIPVAYGYDYLYDLLAQKLITKEVYRNILKIGLPLSIGLLFQLGKLPFGKIISGTGYGVSIVSGLKMLFDKFIRKSSSVETAQTPIVANDDLYSNIT